MEQVALWAMVFAAAVIGTPIVAVAVHQKRERRHQAKMGRRRKSKINL